MFAVEFIQRVYHVKRSVNGQGGMSIGVHWGAPKGHDAITHVFVDGAPVSPYHLREPTEDRVEEGLQLGRLHFLRQLGEAPHVAKHHRQLAGLGLHRVAVRVLEHFADQLGRNISAEEVGKIALGAALHEVAITHVQCKCRQQHKQ